MVLTLMGMVPTVAHFIADLVIAAGGAFVMLVILRGI